ncbi:BTAD domain-containing putative transcriptional regulator [Micromonospora sp. M12]
MATAEDARLFADVAALRAQAALAGAGPLDEVDLSRLVARTPPDEPSAALLVRVLAAQGREAEALEVVERLRTELADRYGTDPSPVITAVHLALLRGELTAPPVAAPPRQQPARIALPAAWRRSLTALVGRERDVESVTTALAETPGDDRGDRRRGQDPARRRGDAPRRPGNRYA